MDQTALGERRCRQWIELDKADREGKRGRQTVGELNVCKLNVPRLYLVREFKGAHGTNSEYCRMRYSRTSSARGLRSPHRKRVAYGRIQRLFSKSRDYKYPKRGHRPRRSLYMKLGGSRCIAQLSFTYRELDSARLESSGSKWKRLSRSVARLLPSHAPLLGAPSDRSSLRSVHEHGRGFISNSKPEDDRAYLSLPTENVGTLYDQWEFSVSTLCLPDHLLD